MTARALTQVYLHPAGRIDVDRLRWAAFTGLSVTAGVLLPFTMHEFGIAAKIFLPIPFMVLFAGTLLGARAGVLAGLFIPLISFAISGMPPKILPLTLESVAYGACAGFLIHGRRWAPLWGLAVAIAAGRILHLIAMLGFGYAALSVQLRSLLIVAAPGTALQLIFIPPLTTWLVRALGLTPPREAPCGNA